MDLAAAKVGPAISPLENYQFAGWRVLGTQSPNYNPGDIFVIDSNFAEYEQDGTMYVTLEPVFIQIGDTTITYDVNTPTGATATGTVLTGLTNNTQEKLLLNGSVTLHDGSGFAVPGYTLIGWSDKPLQPSQNRVHLNDDGTFAGDIPSDTHIFKLGGTYGVSDENGNSLYAVWESLPELRLVKYDSTTSGDSKVYLAGATFSLTHTSGTTITLTTTAAADGVLSGGLKDGSWALVETNAPEGYLITEGTVTLTVKNEQIKIGDQLLTPDKSVTDHNVYILEVPNTPGVSLPSTGGPGTAMIYLLGAMLTGVAGAGFAARKTRKG